ncbi:MAG: POTRA domain-containing protein [Terriglobales bacterium]
MAASSFSQNTTAQPPGPTPTQQPSETPKTASQVKQALSSYEGQNVTSVELAGQPQVNITALQPLLAQKAGTPFSTAKVDESIAALKRTGQFSNVQLEVRPEPKGIRVLFVLQPAVYFGIYQFPGAERFSYTRLLQVTNYPPRGVYTPVDVEDARKELGRFFQHGGFFLAEVRSEVRTDAEHGLANVLFHVDLSRRAKFGDVVLEGVPPREREHLGNAVHSIWARLRGAAIRPGKTFKRKTVDNAAQYLEKQLNKQGFLAARVHLAGADYNPETNRANVLYRIQPGPEVHVKVEGAHLWPWTRRRLLPVFQQVGVNPELIQEGQRNLISHFQKKGYFDAKVDTDVAYSDNHQFILYRINKGPRHKVSEVHIVGNQHIPDEELLPHLEVEQAHFLSHGKYSAQLVQRTIRNLKNIYESNGFRDAQITPVVRPKDGNIDVTFGVDEGPQDIVERLRIEGNKQLTQADFAPKGLQLAPGNPYSQKAANADRNQIMANYLKRGFLTVTFRETVHPIPQQPHRLEVVYHLDEGPQVRTATVVTLGREETQQKLINHDLVDIRTGHPLTEDGMFTSETQLYKSGVFDWAAVDPRRQVTTQTQEDVLVKVHESRPNAITYGFGFEVINRGGSVPSGTVAVPGLPPVGLPSTFKTSEKTFWGPRGTFEYTRKNVRGKAESISFAGFAGRLDQRGSVTYTDPTFRWTKWKTSASISGEHNSENPIFTSRQGLFEYQGQRALNPDESTNLFLRYEFRQTGLTRLLIPALISPQDTHVRLSTVSISYVRDTRDHALDAHKGIYESFELSMSPSVLGSNFDFARFLGQTAYYKNVGSGIIWANSIRLGFEKPLSGDHIPLSEAFFSGGGSTLRGFPLNGAGPQRTIPACGNPADPSTCSLITVPVGGNQLLILNSEFRIPLRFINKNFGMAAFYDGGNVFPKIGFHGQYTNSVGGGFRYNTPVGPVRFDVGHNLNAPPGIKATQIFVTLGQAF